jgi:hypothetical protein
MADSRVALPTPSRQTIRVGKETERMSTRLIGGNIIAKMRKRKPKEGDNTLHSFTALGKRYRMVAVVREGRIADWAAVDSAGKRHKTVSLKASAEGEGGEGDGGVTCWRCFVDPKGHRHCVEIPCPEGPMTPWPGYVA